MFEHEQKIIKRGSQPFNQSVGILVAGTITWYDVASQFGNAAKLFEPLDSIVITNNSAYQIEFYLDTADQTWIVLPYQIQPINRRSFRRYGIKNAGSGNTVSGDITLQLKRLPLDTVNVDGVR